MHADDHDPCPLRTRADCGRPAVCAALLAVLVAGCSGDRAVVAEDAAPPSADTASHGGDAGGEPAADAGAQAAACPVVGFAACGGELLGAWSFVSFCPEDAAAAAALYEHPYDDREACKDRAQNPVEARSVTSGTVTFTSSTVAVDTTGYVDVTYGFSDACLAVIDREPGAAAEVCVGLQSSTRLSCSYAPGRCTCSARVERPPEQATAPYALLPESRLRLDGQVASYCAADDVLVLDWEQHPVSWRYWILERQ